MIDDALVKAIIEISNNDKVINMVEPDLMWHSKIEEWMVKRIVKAQELFYDEWERVSKNRGEQLQETVISGEGAIHIDT